METRPPNKTLAERLQVFSGQAGGATPAEWMDAWKAGEIKDTAESNAIRINAESLLLDLRRQS